MRIRPPISPRPRQAWLFALALSASCGWARLFPVEMAVVPEPQPRVTFTWTSAIANPPLAIERRLLGETHPQSWQRLTDLSDPIRSYADITVERGKTYEYRLFIATGSSDTSKMVTAVATLDSPLEDGRGGVILVVDRTVGDVLAGDLRQLEMDLAGDGWFVKRIDFDPIGTGDHFALKAAIQEACEANPGINSLFLVGDLPFARSGLLAPDGHVPGTSGGSYRAHETDTYYADLDGAWTDTSRNQSVPGNAEQDNVPGDGKFDQNEYPSTLELAAGRVTFRNIRAGRKRNLEYLRDYLHKNHAWRTGFRQVEYKALAGDSGYMWPWNNWLTPMFGAANFSSSHMSSLLTEARVFGVGTTVTGSGDTFSRVRPTKAIFTTNFRSWRQHWMRTDNLVMSLLAQPDWGLTATWGGRPSSFLHSMAAGKPIGYGFLASQNDLKLGWTQRNYYSLYANSRYSFFDESGNPSVSYNLLGDPTLRLHPLPPPGNVEAVRSGSVTLLTWTAPSVPVAGYHVYRSPERLGVYTRLTATPTPELQWADAPAPSGEVYYQVRAVALTDHPTGRYENQSQGAFVRIGAEGVANRRPVATGATLRTKHNTPLWFNFQGTDPDGAPLTPIILQHPESGQIRWRENQPYYVSGKDFVGTERVVFAMSDGVAVSEPATIEIAVNATGNTLLAWRPAGGSNPLPSIYNAPGIAPAVLDTKGYQRLSAGANDDQFTFRYIQTALTSGHYVHWTVAPQGGGRLNLDRLSFALAGTADITFHYELRASIDDFATHIVVPLQHGNSLTGVGTTRNVGVIQFADLSAIPALQNVAGPVSFRLHVWKTVGGGTHSAVIGKLTEAEGQEDGIEDLSVTGTVSGLADTDGNGLPDAWELIYAGRIGLVPEADEFGSGLSNIAAFLLGYERPATTRDAGALRQSVVEGPAVEGNTRHLSLEFRRRKERGTISATVESSADLQSWVAVSAAEEILSDDGVFEQVRVRVPQGSHPKLFLRLKVGDTP